MNLTAAYELARKLMDENGLALPNWNFQFNRASSTFGMCQIHRDRITKVCSGTIFLSRSLTELNTEERVRRTILHEIAHAKAYIRLGRDAGHGVEWKREAIALGISPIRGFTESDTVTPEPRWTATCKNGHISTQMRLSRHIRSCGQCSPIFNKENVLVYKRNPKFK